MHGCGNTVEVCIDDQWHETTSAKVANNSHSSQNISIKVDSTSVMIKWSEQQSIPNDKIISGYDLSCTASALSDGQIHEVKLLNISTSTTIVQVNGLLPGTAYECCVNAHIQTNTPLDLISSSCVATRTEFVSTRTESIQEPNDGLVIGLGSGLGICSLLLVLVVSIQVGYIVSKISCLKHDSTIQGSTKRYDISHNNQFIHYCDMYILYTYFPSQLSHEVFSLKF